jgi:hypothetical protein
VGALKRVRTQLNASYCSLSCPLSGMLSYNNVSSIVGHFDVVKYLVQTVKIRVDEIGDRRLTSLHLACKNGHVKTVSYLLKQGASTTFRNSQLYNCLEIAITHQQEEVVKDVLLDHPTWKQMMRSAQPIEDTEAYDTPKTLFIKYVNRIQYYQKLILVCIVISLFPNRAHA